MERKIPFVVEWIPEMSRVLFLKPGRFIISPAFATKFKNTAYKWHIIFYPNGYNLSQIDPVPTSDDYLEDQMMSEEEEKMYEDDESSIARAPAINTSPNSAIFIVLSPFSTGSAKHMRVKAKVEFQISLKEGTTPLIGKMEDTLFRTQKIDAIKTGGDPSKILKGIHEFGPLCKGIVEQFSLVSDDRMAIACRLYIDAADFDHWIGRQKALSSIGDSRGRHNRISQRLKACNIANSDDTESQSPTEKFDSISATSFDPVSVDEAIAAEIGDQADLTIISNDDRIFKCHYGKLSASSDILGRLFDPNSSPLIDKSNHSVTLADMNGKIWSFLLYFIYFDKFPTEAIDFVAEILDVARKYMIKNLPETCQTIMLGNLDCTNIFDYFKVSINHDLPDLKEACLNFIYCNRVNLFGENGHNVEVQEKLFAEDENIGMILLSLLANRASKSTGVISFH
uniref:BTB domain-containing protein n=1 Tax=Romanomermis culicivorax TaxID=13658 RepID=A0A915IZL8_ROMCU